MTAEEILLSKSTLSSGTASDVLKAITTEIRYTGRTEFVNTDAMLAGTKPVMGTVNQDSIDGDIEPTVVECDVGKAVISADIIDSDKE